MVTSLGQLLSGSWSFFQKNIAAILIGAAIFGALMTAAQSLVVGKMQGSFAPVLGQMGVDTERLQELQGRAMRGDEAAMEELARMSEEVSKRFAGMGEEQATELATGMVRAFIRSVMPTLGWSFLLFAIIGLVASTYFFVIAVEERKDFMEVLSRIPPLLLPLAAVWLWAFIRSFAWIPIAGIVPAIIFGPRFLLSPVILLKEQKGVVESVRLSYERTRGYWGKIVGNILVCCILIVLALWATSMLLSFLPLMTPLIKLLLSQTAQQAAVAFGSIFAVQLSLAILAHPRRA